jgi:hypothetical protein
VVVVVVEESADTRRQRNLDNLEKDADRLRRQADALSKHHEYNPNWRERVLDLQDRADRLDRRRELLLLDQRREQLEDESALGGQR